MPASQRWMIFACYTTVPATGGEPVVVSFERFLGYMTAVFEPLVLNNRRTFATYEVYEQCLAYGVEQGWKLRETRGMRPAEPYTPHERYQLSHFRDRSEHPPGDVILTLDDWKRHLSAWTTHYYCDNCSTHDNPELLYHCLDCYRFDGRDLTCYELCNRCYPQCNRGEHQRHRFARANSRRFARHVHRQRLAVYPTDQPLVNCDNNPSIVPVHIVAVDSSDDSSDDSRGAGFRLFD